MKIEISKNVKRALSMVIAFALLLGTLFTANVGVNIKADAATGTAVEKRILHWDGTNKTVPNTQDEDGNYIIDTAEKLAWIVGQTDASLTRGKNYKVANGIGTIILQNSKNIDAAKLMACTDGAETRKYFDNITRDKWVTTTSTVFAGNFDGNGVEIYGEYAYFYQGGGSGIFGMVAQGVTLKNFAVKNSYLYQASGKAGAIFGGVNATDNGTVTIENVIVSGCYLWAGESNNNYGIMVGSTASGTKIGLTVKNCLVYNNTFYYKDDTTKKCGIVGTMSDIDPDIPSGSTEIEEEELGADNQFENCIILDCAPYSVFDNNNKPLKAVNYKNMYTNGIDPNDNKTWPCLIRNNIWGYTWNNYAGKIFSIDSDSVKGSVGKTIMSDFNWATAETAGNGTSQWYARENDYPTPLMPTGWQDTVKAIPVFSGTAAATYAEGSGTKADPFLIETPDQLYKMVTDGAETEGKYYTIADGVEKLYLNDIIDTNDAATDYSAIEALYNSNKYSNWNTTAEFLGNFDGKGVTLVGMISKDGKGFFGKMSGNATIKNVNFESCYVYSSNSRAAVVATDFGSFDKGDHYPTISNVSVRKSYINSQQGGVSLRDSEPYAFWYSTAGGIASCIATSDMLTITNCMYDGTSSKLVQKDYANGDVEVDASAGILSMASSVNNVIISNCVSLGAPIITEGVGKGGAAINYERYKSDSKVTATNCYTNTNLTLTSIDGKTVDASYWNAYPLPTTINRVNATGNKYERGDFLYLDWANSWKLVTIDANTVIPMPTSSTVEPIKSTYTTFGKMLVAHNGIGLRSGSYPNQNGTFGWYHELTGSGTKADPYIIDTAEKLAIAIATGGKNLNDKLYYKLGCDINLGLLPWIDKTDIGNEYTYTEFVGTLDGDGHTVSGLSFINDDIAVGLVPVLNGGTVKNLHVRASNLGSNTGAGAIVGKVKSGEIIGCSVENSHIAGNVTNAISGTNAATNNIKNSYTIVDGNAKYYLAGGTEGTPAPADFYAENNTSAVWYKGGDGGTARLVNFAKAHTIADIEGNGVVDAYDINDVVALRNYLLGVDGYANVYGDVTGNGKTNISDLAIIRREMVGDYKDPKDGFWRNVELGAVKIYYDQNDSQDMARKLELYLESVYPEVDIVKVAGTAVTDTTISEQEKADYNNKDNANQENAIVITKTAPTVDTYMNYSASYDKSKNVLKINGHSFTAVEQAVLDLIAQFKANNNSANPTGITGSILTADDTTKQYKRVYTSSNDYVDYYYAWGDEFNEGTTYSANTWKIKDYRTEGANLNGLAASDARTGDTFYLNLEAPNVENLTELWKVENDGKLHIWRGVNTDVYNGSEDYTWGYKGVAAGTAGTTNDFGSTIDNDDIYIDAGLITTEQSMMFKQGYAEMKGSLPSDGHAFPSWWFLTGSDVKYNSSMTQRLYNKVYKFNEDWDDKINAMDPANLATYKYAVPKAYLEFDIVEFMQAQAGKSGSNAITTGDYRDYINLTIHKTYNQNVKDGNLYIPNWDTSDTKYVTGTAGKAVPLSAFNNTSSNPSDFIHRYNPNKITAKYANTYSGSGITDWWKEYNTAASYSVQEAIAGGALTSGTVTDEYTYGFSWSVDEKAKTYKLNVYIDFDNDGIMKFDEIIFSMDQSAGHESTYKGKGLTDQIYNSSDLSADCAVWNQYAHMLLDNSFYTSNPQSSSGNGVTLFTDLLTQNSGNGTAGATDKTTFDVDYVRVYQQDGRRDLVTAETEAFNTGNHFGY